MTQDLSTKPFNYGRSAAVNEQHYVQTAIHSRHPQRMKILRLLAATTTVALAALTTIAALPLLGYPVAIAGLCFSAQQLAGFAVGTLLTGIGTFFFHRSVKSAANEARKKAEKDFKKLEDAEQAAKAVRNQNNGDVLCRFAELAEDGRGNIYEKAPIQWFAKGASSEQIPVLMRGCKHSKYKTISFVKALLDDLKEAENREEKESFLEKIGKALSLLTRRQLQSMFSHREYSLSWEELLPLFDPENSPNQHLPRNFKREARKKVLRDLKEVIERDAQACFSIGDLGIICSMFPSGDILGDLLQHLSGQDDVREGKKLLLNEIFNKELLVVSSHSLLQGLNVWNERNTGLGYQEEEEMENRILGFLGERDLSDLDSSLVFPLSKMLECSNVLSKLDELSRKLKDLKNDRRDSRVEYELRRILQEKRLLQTALDSLLTLTCQKLSQAVSARISGKPTSSDRVSLEYSEIYCLLAHISYVSDENARRELIGAIWNSLKEEGHFYYFLESYLYYFINGTRNQSINEIDTKILLDGSQVLDPPYSDKLTELLLKQSSVT